MSKVVFLAAVLLALQAVSGATTSQSAVLTLAGSSCTGHAFTGLSAKYDYNLTLSSLTVPTGCADANIRISKLYVEGTCASTRNNDFSITSPQDVTCSDKVTSATDATICQEVFSSSNSDWVTANLVTLGSTIDSGNICISSGADGFVFIQNNCTQIITADVTFSEGDYTGSTCLEVAGHAVSKGLIIGIVIAGVVALIILGILIKCCCCCL